MPENLQQPGAGVQLTGTTPEQRAHWRALAEAASPHWCSSGHGDILSHRGPNEYRQLFLSVMGVHNWRGQWRNDVAFALAAREAMPLLLADVERLEAERDQLRAVVADYVAAYDHYAEVEACFVYDDDVQFNAEERHIHALETLRDALEKETTGP